MEIQIIKEGIGELPQQDDEVYFFYCCKNHNGEFISGSQHTATRCVIGKGWLIEPLENALKQMRQGQRNLVKVFHNGATREYYDEYEIEVIRIGKRRNKPWDLEGDQPYEQALSLKQQGNLFIKEGNYRQAQNIYLSGLRLIEQVYDDREQSLIIQLRANLTLTHLKNKEYENCVQQASEVLKIQANNIKLLHRRAVAYIEMREFESAKVDLNRGLEIDPGNGEVQKELQDLHNKEKSLIKKEQERAKKMLFG